MTKNKQQSTSKAQALQKYHCAESSSYGTYYYERVYKRVSLQLSTESSSEHLSSALGFMHLKSLVHRDLKLENILVFAKDFSRIKLCYFGDTTPLKNLRKLMIFAMNAIGTKLKSKVITY